MFQAPNSPAPQPLAPTAGEYTRQFAPPVQQAPPPHPAAGPQPPLQPPPMPMGAPNPNRMTVVDMPSIPASAFDPVRPAGGPPPPQQPRPPQAPAPSGVTVEFNRLFDEPKSPGAQQSH